jgi:hypothetical protein
MLVRRAVPVLRRTRSDLAWRTKTVTRDPAQSEHDYCHVFRPPPVPFRFFFQALQRSLTDFHFLSIGDETGAA